MPLCQPVGLATCQPVYWLPVNLSTCQPDKLLPPPGGAQRSPSIAATLEHRLTRHRLLLPPPLLLLLLLLLPPLLLPLLQQ